MIQRNDMSAALARRLFSYDPATGILSWLPNVGARRAAGEAGFLSPKGYRVVQWQGRRYKAHRIIWTWVTGEPPPEEIDHENTDKAHNAWANLRAATSSQNKANVGLRSDNRSGHKGVTWDTGRGKWFASIAHKGRTLSLGRHVEFQSACAAYRRKAEELHGPYARTA